MTSRLFGVAVCFAVLRTALSQEDDVSACSEQELVEYNRLSQSCQLTDCLRAENQKYADLVAERYPADDVVVKRVGIQFAACECSCSAETCEVQKIAEEEKLSDECKVQILEKCRDNDVALTARCKSLAANYPNVYDITVDNDPLGFARECQGCSALHETLIKGMGTEPEDQKTNGAVQEGDAGGRQGDEEGSDDSATEEEHNVDGNDRNDLEKEQEEDDENGMKSDEQDSGAPRACGVPLVAGLIVAAATLVSV